MIRSTAILSGSAKRKETPVRELPRMPINLIIEAERQGFDDGYFGNEMQIKFKSNEIGFAYQKSFLAGRNQKEEFNRKDGKKRKVKR
jgi:hypothetical protein